MNRRIRILISIITILLSIEVSADDTKVVIVDRPNTEATNDNYVHNRAPLLKEHFIKLPVGKVKPEGWILKLLEFQRDGLNGQLGEISAWLDKENNAWLGTGNDYGWEEVPYWLKGYGNMAYILEDKEMIKEMCHWLVTNGFADTPLHFSRFFPTYKMKDARPTPVPTLELARSIALASGIRYVHLGNVPGE